ncbi:hypothetical protein [Psychrobacter sp. I-STPA6b]|uniref:hypothetical protein n=1 Tax=Psychrobacter sp. I-STPA6b TaxID=2585718 RepID=UPI001D0C590E|nr:hypothetical protein [Psychrobacter sp. I-STPA6b]
MKLKTIATACALFGTLIISQYTLAASSSITKQQASNPNNFHAGSSSKDIPDSIGLCSASLLACAERVLSYEQARLDVDANIKLGKNIGMAELFIYPQARSQPDVGVVIITEQPYGDDGDDSVSGERHRIAFIEQEDRRGNPYWKFVSYRYQWLCARPGSDGSWSKNLCP